MGFIALKDMNKKPFVNFFRISILKLWILLLVDSQEVVTLQVLLMKHQPTEPKHRGQYCPMTLVLISPCWVRAAASFLHRF